MIAIGSHLPMKIKKQAAPFILLGDEPPQAVARARAVDFNLFLSQPADHVHIEGNRHMIERHRRIAQPMSRAEEPLLLAVPKRK